MSNQALLNENQCTGANLMNRLITFQDFEHNPQNPFFLAYSYVNSTTTADEKTLFYDSYYMIVFTACYAYSIFRVFMDLTKILYSYKKIEIIFSDKKNREIMSEKDHRGNKTPRVIEIEFYKNIIYLNVLCDFCMSVHNFLLWRGLHYYTSYLLYTKSNCIYSSDLISVLNESNDKMEFIRIMIIVWVTLDSIRMFVTYFSVLTLSRINRKEKSGMDFLKPNLIKSVALSFLYWILIFVMVFVFNLPLYFKFLQIEVLCFWFFWKSLGFFLLFDRLHSKFWLFQNLKFQALHSHGIEWKKKLGKVKDTILYEEKKKGLIEQIREILEEERKNKDIDEGLYQKIGHILENQGNEIQKTYVSKIEEFYKNNIEKEIIDRYEEEKKSKLKTKWADYLNFILGLTLLGIVGYLFLLLDNTINKNLDNNKEQLNTPYATFYIGIFFCYAEILISDLSHGIFLLHCFFIELFGFLKENQLKQKFSEANEENELIELDPEAYDQIMT